MPLPSVVVETPFGFAGIIWKGEAVGRFFLPERNRTSLERRMAAAGAGVAALPSGAAALIERVKRYFDGAADDFGDVEVDLAGIDDFRLAIYAQARRLGFGETTTYGELAARAGHPGMARETGQALGSNPVPLIVPCHRIHAAGGKIGGFSAPGGSTAKERMLALEGVRLGPPPSPQMALDLG